MASDDGFREVERVCADAGAAQQAGGYQVFVEEVRCPALRVASTACRRRRRALACSRDFRSAQHEGTCSSSFLNFLTELEHEGVVTLHHGDVPPRLKGAYRRSFEGGSAAPRRPAPVPHTMPAN